jgi:hypothetical protein
LYLKALFQEQRIGENAGSKKAVERKNLPGMWASDEKKKWTFRGILGLHRVPGLQAY